MPTTTNLTLSLSLGLEKSFEIILWIIKVLLKVNMLVGYEKRWGMYIKDVNGKGIMVI